MEMGVGYFHILKLSMNIPSGTSSKKYKSPFRFKDAVYAEIEVLEMNKANVFSIIVQIRPL